MLLTLPPMLSDKMMPLSIAVFPQTAPLAFIFDFHVDFSGSAGAEGVAVRRGGGGGGAAIVTVRPKEGKDGLRVLYYLVSGEERWCARRVFTRLCLRL